MIDTPEALLARLRGRPRRRSFDDMALGWQDFADTSLRVDTVSWAMFGLPRWLCALFGHPLMFFAPPFGLYVGACAICRCEARSVWW